MVNEKDYNFCLENQGLLLHFEGVDQVSKVYLNNKYVGQHYGSYLPFNFEINEYIVNGNNHLKS